MTKLVSQLNNCEYEYEIAHKFDRQYCLFLINTDLLSFLLIWYRYIEIRVDEHKCLFQKT